MRGVNAAGGGSASARVGGTPMFAIPNRPTGFAADAGDAVVDLSWVDPEDSTIDKYQLLQIIQGGKLTTASTDDPVVRGDGFGISVAADGDTAVVGAYQDDDATNDNSGSAHVFTWNSSNSNWEQKAKLTASDAATTTSSALPWRSTATPSSWERTKTTATKAPPTSSPGIRVTVIGNRRPSSPLPTPPRTTSSALPWRSTATPSSWERTKTTATKAPPTSSPGIRVTVIGNRRPSSRFRRRHERRVRHCRGGRRRHHRRGSAPKRRR